MIGAINSASHRRAHGWVERDGELHSMCGLVRPVDAVTECAPDMWPCALRSCRRYIRQHAARQRLASAST